MKDGKIVDFELVNGEIINIFAKQMNFTKIYVANSGGHGHRFPNGTFDGGLGALESGAADIMGNLMMTFDYNTTNSVFLKPFAEEVFSFLIRVPDVQKELLITISESVDLLSRILYVSTVIICIFVLKFLMSFGNTKISFVKSGLTIFGILTNISMKLPNSRIFFTSVLLFGVIQSSLIQSIIVKSLNSNKNYGEIKTLDQLLDNNYEILTGMGLAPQLMILDGSRMARKLKEIARAGRFVGNFSVENLKPKTAYLHPDRMIRANINSNFDNITKANLLIAVPEPAYKFYGSILVTKNSNFLEKFNKIIQIVIEAGIVEYQISLGEFENTKILIKRIKNGNVSKESSKVIKISDLKLAFFLYLMLNFTALIVFMCEVFIDFIFIRICNGRKMTQ
jgi:hypothetical protein